MCGIGQRIPPHPAPIPHEQTKLLPLPLPPLLRRRVQCTSPPPFRSMRKSAYLVLQQVHPGMNIRSSASALVVSMMQWTMISFTSLVDPVMRSSTQLIGESAAAPLVAHLRKIMSNELLKYAKIEAVKALAKAASSSSDSSAWDADEAGLQVDPRNTVAQCAQHAVPVSRCVAVAVSAVIEYIAAEVLECAGHAAAGRSRDSIDVCDVKVRTLHDSLQQYTDVRRCCVTRDDLRKRCEQTRNSMCVLPSPAFNTL